MRRAMMRSNCLRTLDFTLLCFRVKKFFHYILISLDLSDQSFLLISNSVTIDY